MNRKFDHLLCKLGSYTVPEQFNELCANLKLPSPIYKLMPLDPFQQSNQKVDNAIDLTSSMKSVKSSSPFALNNYNSNSITLIPTNSRLSGDIKKLQSSAHFKPKPDNSQPISKINSIQASRIKVSSTLSEAKQTDSSEWNTVAKVYRDEHSGLESNVRVPCNNL